MLTRRNAIKATTAFLAIAGSSPLGLAQSVIDGKFQPLFTLPPLPYAFDTLEPHLDARTMQIHHDLHHGGYVKNLNQAIAGIPQFYFDLKTAGATEATLERLLDGSITIPPEIRTVVRNNAGGHYNHSLFWQMMKKNGSGQPKGQLAKALGKDFGSFDNFKAEFSKASLALFGSGWVWLTSDAGKLRIETSPNQDSPVSVHRPVLLGIDLWEHAYYLEYQNRRADYVKAWFNVVDWDYVSERYAKIK